MQTDDFLDDILSLESGGGGGMGCGLPSSGDRDSPDMEARVKQESLAPEEQVHALAKDRQKKDNHNMSESLFVRINQLTPL